MRVVAIEGLGQFRLDAATVAELALEEDGSLDAPAAHRVVEAARHQDSRAAALRLLGRRLRGRAELARALRRRGTAETTVEIVLAELAHAGWIDDARFARAWISDRLALRPIGRRRLKAELRAKGVASQIVDNAIDALLTRDAEEDLALRQAGVRWSRLRRLSPHVARRRLAAWLQRRGFAQAAVARALRTLTDERDVDTTA